MAEPAGRFQLSIDTAEFRRSWKVLVLAMLGVGINSNSSMLYAFGTLVLPLQKAFGWARGDLQQAMSFLFAGAVISAQTAGWLNLRFGMKRVTVVSLLALSLAFLAMTQMGRHIGWLYACMLMLPIASLGTMQVTWTQLVNLWFRKNRGLALALVLSGTGLAAMALPPATAWAVDRWGWQAAFVLLAMLPVVLVLPLTLRWLILPGELTQHSSTADQARLNRQVAASAELNLPGLTIGQAVRKPRFWCLNLGLVLVVGSVVAMVTGTVPLLRDKGLSAAEAAGVFGSFGLSLIVGRSLMGYLADRLWAPGVAAVVLCLPALGCQLLLHTPASGLGLLTLATMLIGVGAGAEFDVAAFLVARYYGLRDYGRVFGLHLALITAGSAISPALAGRLFNATGSYTAVLWICTACFLIGPLLLLVMGPYPKFDPQVSAEP